MCKYTIKPRGTGQQQTLASPANHPVTQLTFQQGAAIWHPSGMTKKSPRVTNIDRQQAAFMVKVYDLTQFLISLAMARKLH
jgi:hypothetical protein